ncbi:MAG TPA: hypothetical protein VNV86_11515 [Candidatus Acidoferrum sp.]|jgi:hypothetical protein|nr:hypothetical protein [Candidatus Acidoferrum sp.]
MKALLCLIALAVFALAAPPDQDLSGKWTGSFNMSSPDGEAHDGGIVMTLKQNGSELTGTAGPNENDQFPITKGKVDGNKITLEVQRGEGQVIKFELAIAGDRIKGGANMSNNGETRTAKVDVGRAK